MEKKTDIVRRMTADGDYKSALRIAKDFRLGISKQDSSAMKLAYECIVHGEFYRQLGYDLNAKVAEGTEVLKRLYGRSESVGLYQQIQ